MRVIDALAVYKDKDGEIEVEHLSNLSEVEAVELGSKVADLVGVDILDEVAAPEAAGNGDSVLADDDAWDVIGEIPNDTAAALLLIEHHWAVPLRDAVVRAHGFRIADAFISPLDLVDVGLMAADEAAKHQSIETAAGAARGRQ